MIRSLKGPRAGLLFPLLVANGMVAQPVLGAGPPPSAQVLVKGDNVEYVVRFPTWVDHNTSTLFVTENNRIVLTLRPSHDTEPAILAASTPRLAPGDYVLHWSAASVPDGGLIEGSTEFVVPK